MKTTIKEVFESNNWIITKIIQGYNGKVRIDAKTRFHVPDEDNFFSNWCSRDYAERLARDNYGKNVSDFSCYKY